MTGSPRALLSGEGRVALGIALLTVLGLREQPHQAFISSTTAARSSTTRRSATSAPRWRLFPTAHRSADVLLVNLTLAVNYAMSGLAVWSYHATNLLIHVLAALALFGLMRRALELPSVAPRFRGTSVEIAGVMALLWAVHPLPDRIGQLYFAARRVADGGCFIFSRWPPSCAACRVVTCAGLPLRRSRASPGWRARR